MDVFSRFGSPGTESDRRVVTGEPIGLDCGIGGWAQTSPAGTNLTATSGSERGKTMKLECFELHSFLMAIFVRFIKWLIRCPEAQGDVFRCVVLSDLKSKIQKFSVQYSMKFLQFLRIFEDY